MMKMVKAFSEAYQEGRHEENDPRSEVRTRRIVPSAPPRFTSRMSMVEGERSIRSGSLFAALSSRTNVGISSSAVALFGGGGASSRGGGGGGDYSYALIRSDLEDDSSPKTTVPRMRSQHFGVRQRSMQAMPEGIRSRLLNVSAGVSSWVSSGWFTWICGAAIVINSVVVGLELQIHSPLWFYMEQGLLGFFCCELALRLAAYGKSFFVHEEDWAWNIFDVVVVLLGIFDQWMVPLAEHLSVIDPRDGAPGGSMNRFYMTIIICRLLRIIRLLRLVRIVRPLYALSKGVAEALSGMFWVLVFMVMTLYSVAILCTRMVGHGDILSEEMTSDPEIIEIQAMFGSVPDSMFTLFGMISSWSLFQYMPLFEDAPGLKGMFVIFYIYSAWALLAVMTGVVSENMIAIREQMTKEDANREEMRKTLITNMLMELFQSADVDHSGTVSKEEFDAMLQTPTLLKKMKRNSNLKVQDLQDLFEWLDYDGSGLVTIDEFMVGFKWVNEPLRTKSLVKLQERLATDLQVLQTESMQALNVRSSDLKNSIQAPLRKVHAITEQIQSLDIIFGVIRSRMREQAASVPTATELDDVAIRLSNKIESAALFAEQLRSQAAGIQPSQTNEAYP